MSTEYKKPALSPKPKILSHLAFKLPSSLMSRPRASARGPKPPVAPKPKVLHDPGEKCCLNDKDSLIRCSNGDLILSEEELDQENEPEGSLGTGDRYEEECDNEEELEVEPHPVSEHEEEQNGADEVLSDTVMEGNDCMDTPEISDIENLSDSANEIIHRECADDTHSESCDASNVSEDTSGLSEFSLTSDGEGTDSQQHHEEKPEDLGVEKESSPEGAGPAEEATDQFDAVEKPHGEENEASFAKLDDEDSESRVSEGDHTVQGSTPLSVDVNRSESPSPCKECPYDMIGAPCDNCEPSKDLRDEDIPDYSSDGELVNTTDSLENSHLAEETAPTFQPYSVIDTDPVTIVVDDKNIGAKIGLDCDAITSKPCSNSQELLVTNSDTNPEPYYVSSEDIVNIEENQVQPEGAGHEPPESEHPPDETAQVMENKERSDHYTDIDDESVCQDAEDLQQLECISSEDYVEIGDSDEEATDKRRKRVAKKGERTGKCRKALLNQCSQPRFRLCSITVPADMDMDRASELTNRLVFADTSDVFGDDMDFEGHIVPYMEDVDTERDNISDEHVYEEAGLDSEGENFLNMDRKSVVTRSRSLSGKVPGYVPETVPEETGGEYQTHDYYTVALDKSGHPLSDSEQLEVNRMIPSSKARRFILYPRSYSVEGREMPMCVYRETEHSPCEEGRMKRTDDNLSLPCFIGSSGSFSQRSHLPSSGMSTPTSVVDIPPPFELASITKKPITKSSPSLLIENDSSDKQKKKKSSFKRFLTLKFRRKTENKVHVDVNVSSSRSSSESSHHGPLRVLDMDRRSTGSSPQLKVRSGKPQRLSDSPSTFLFYKDGKRKGGPKTFNNRRISRVESFEDRSRPPFMPLPLTKPRSISFPNADTSDYENIPAMSSDYENIQIQPRAPTRPGTFAEFFDDPNRALASANENDGYVDMSSFTGFENKPQQTDQEPESAYTEPYRVCAVSSGPLEEAGGEEDQGRTSEEEDGGTEHSYDRQVDGRSRAFYIAKELVDSEKEHVKGLKLLQEDFRQAVEAAVGEDGEPVLKEERLKEILNELPEVYQLHCHILTELERCMRQWDESQRIADVILSRRAELSIFTPYMAQYDRSAALLEESCQHSPAFAAIVRQFEQQSPAGRSVALKQQLLQVIVRVLQYRMLLTDYLNNLSPDSVEYEDTQAALAMVSEVADQANDSLRDGENLLRLVHIEYSVRGQRDLLQPGRVFVKEGTLMKVSRKSRQPRHLFLMNDMMLYTYPQQDGKYRLKNTLSLAGMKVSKPIIENVQNALRIEVSDISITLSAGSCGERDDWFHTLSRTVADHARGPGAFSTSSGEAREKLWMSLGETAPTLVPVSHVMMCMNCTSDFSLTLRRHHCHACGKIVCRGCSRNKYPLKYLKDRMAKVCDHCYAELKKRGGGVAGASGTDSPRSNRYSRPLSAVFQNIHPPNLWRHRKTTVPLNQVTSSADSPAVSSNLHRCKRSKRNWKKLWFLLKDKVLYTSSAHEDKVASESLPLLGFTVKLPERPEGEDSANVFQLYHKKTLYYTFRAEDNHAAQRWVNAIEEATVL
ncbi:FYVE, RhoGEF and PH domain-containing protein 5-like isoform X2 [Megalops cyprinoides]|uniref:FYVE, RhoGEF and PH domain-containing protein 5-like isoform X2 n=1 Tax=Megalops cyprinoides TaxID=118141 RepID=UPI001864367E|nr:FYVE, RhoGEF and PH domain-containing protein 5-like isoform X2 [Megalops cyprinoides]